MKTLSFVSRARGFSLIELLVVCSIIALIVGFTVPAATTMIRGSQLTQGSQLLTDQLALARQQALTRNLPVEVRFYKFADPESVGENVEQPETGKYRAFQSFAVQQSIYVPLNSIQRLPTTVVLSEGALSTLINDSKIQPAKKAKDDPTTPELPRGVKRNYEYVSFRYMPDGSTNLPLNSSAKGNWFLTMHGVDLNSKLSSAKDGTGKLINYFTIQVDPISGTSRTFRPSVGS